MFTLSKLSDREWYFRKLVILLGPILSKKELERINLLHKIRRVYKNTFHRKLHFYFPSLLSEKLIWLSWYWRDPIKSICADKYKMRDYVVNECHLPNTLLVPLHGVYYDVSEIDFDSLPNEFVLKCNHGCGYNIIVKDKTKIDKSAVLLTLNKWLSEDYQGGVAEFHYKDISPHLILCEKFLHNSGESDVKDYKVYCIYGEPKWIVCCFDRDETQVARVCTFSTQWEQLFLTRDEQIQPFPKPSSLDEMLEYSRMLSKQFPIVRVDFYEVEGKPYLGELTFTPMGNMDTDYTEDAQIELGRIFTLPSKRSLRRA